MIAKATPFNCSAWGAWAGSKCHIVVLYTIWNRIENLKIHVGGNDKTANSVCLALGYSPHEPPILLHTWVWILAIVMSQFHRGVVSLWEGCLFCFIGVWSCSSFEGCLFRLGEDRIFTAGYTFMGVPIIFFYGHLAWMSFWGCLVIIWRCSYILGSVSVSTCGIVCSHFILPGGNFLLQNFVGKGIVKLDTWRCGAVYIKVEDHSGVH